MYGQELVDAIRDAIVTHRIEAIKDHREPPVVMIALTPQSYNEVKLVWDPKWWQESYRDGNLQERMFGCDIRVDYKDEHKMIADGLFFKLLQSS